jgi:hypothetical protein
MIYNNKTKDDLESGGGLIRILDYLQLFLSFKQKKKKKQEHNKQTNDNK